MKMKRAKHMKRLWPWGQTERRGAAVVEMAVVSPLLLAMMLGMIEFGYIFMVQQILTNGAREACRTATLPGITDAEVKARFDEAIAATGLEVTDDMFTITSATAGDPVVSVRVQIPYDDVTLLGVLPSSLFSGMFGGGGETSSIHDKTLGSSCSMRVEDTLSL